MESFIVKAAMATAINRLPQMFGDRAKTYSRRSDFQAVAVQRDPDAASPAGDSAASRVPDAISVPYSSVQSESAAAGTV